MRKVLDGKLWPHIGLEPATQINAKLKGSKAAQAHLAENSLLYETIVIPTSDFGILPALIDWLSLGRVRAALEADQIQFVRYPHALGYAGNGNGLCAFQVRPSPNRSFEWWQTAVFGDLHEALELQIAHGCDTTPHAEHKALFEAALKATTTFQLENDEFMRNVANQTYQDIVGDPVLYCAMQNFYPGKEIKLTHFPDISGDQIRVRSPELFDQLSPMPKDAAQLALKIAELNLEITMSMYLGGCDLSTFSGSSALLKRRLERSKIKFDGITRFSQLLEIPGVPDLPSAIYDGRLTLADVWKVRETANGRRFREWLATAGIDDGEELARIYLELLGDEPWIASTESRLLRWAVIVGVGLMYPTAGIALGGLDLFTEKWLKGYSPRLFISELQEMRIEPTLEPSRREH